MESLLQDKCNVNMKDIGKKASQMQISQGSKHSRSNLYENRSLTKSIEILKNQDRDQTTNDEKDSNKGRNSNKNGKNKKKGNRKNSNGSGKKKNNGRRQNGNKRNKNRNKFKNTVPLTGLYGGPL